MSRELGIGLAVVATAVALVLLVEWGWYALVGEGTGAVAAISVFGAVVGVLAVHVGNRLLDRSERRQ